MHAHEVEDRGPICRDTTQVIGPAAHMEVLFGAASLSRCAWETGELVLLPMEQQHRCRFSQSRALSKVSDKNSG